MKNFNFLKKVILGTTLLFSYKILADVIPIFIDSDSHIESIFNYTIDENGIGFRVYTGGCTCKKSFDLIKKDSTDGKLTQLTLVRVSPDHCKGRFPEGTFIWYSFEELNLAPNANLQIENPRNPVKP